MLHHGRNEPRQEQGDGVEHESVKGGVGKGFFRIAFRDNVHSGMTPGASGNGGWSFERGRGNGPKRGHGGRHWGDLGLVTNDDE